MLLSQGKRPALSFPFAASVWLALLALGAPPAEGSYGVSWRGRGPLLVTLDPEGNRTSLQTPRGPATQFEYDELGKLTKVTQPPPALAAPAPVTTYVYDPNRNRTTQTDANGHVVTMEYDDLNRLRKTTQDPSGLALVSETTLFDENGNPKVMVDPKGQTITSTYDELNRLKTKSYAFAVGDATRPWRYTASLEYGYDANGNLTTTDEHIASGTSPPDTTLTTTRTYDRLDRLTSETQPLPNGGSQIVRYTYFKNGTRQDVTDPADRVTRYAYDDRNRLASATTDFGTPQAKTTAYTYEPDDLLKTVSYPNGVVATHAYDKADRLLSILNTKDAALISSYQYSGTHPVSGLPVSYDANGNRLIQIETNGGPPETTTYTYDDLDRLESVTYPVDATYPNGRVVSYGYDAVGNRIRETEKDQADAILADKQGLFDNANRLTELTDLVTPADTTTFTWDPNGNQLTKTTAGVTTENRYDLRDKLVEVVQGPATLGRFQYDPEGRRNLKIGEEGLRQYVYDQTSLLTEYDAGSVQKAKYDYGSDRLIALTRADEGRRYFSLDGLRSVVNLTDDNGLAVASYHLDTWGNFRFPTELDASRNRFAFTGHIFDTETGLYNAKARYFDPKLGRFLTQDSFLGQIDEPPSLHRYLYAGDRPTFYVDPTGHFWSKEDFKNAGKAFAGVVVGAAKTIGSVGVLTYNLTGKALYEATGEWQYRNQAEATDRMVEAFKASPGQFLVEGLTSGIEQFKQGLDRGDAFAMGEGVGVTTTQVLTAAEGVRAGPPQIGFSPALQTAEGVVLQGAGTVARAGGTGQATILMASIANEGGAKTVKENTPTKEDPAPAKAVDAKGSVAPEPPSNPAPQVKGTGNATIGTGATAGGMPRTTSAWRQRYGPAAVREHHLTPQALLKDARFTERLAELGVKDARAFIDRKVAQIPRALHDKLHAEGWNQAWKDWLDANPQFTLKDIEAQITALMKDQKVPASSRNFAKPYGRN